VWPRQSRTQNIVVSERCERQKIIFGLCEHGKVNLMTAAEVYDLTTQGGATDFARVVAACDAHGPWCLIGGLAVNTYVEPVYTLDADLVVILSRLEELSEHLRHEGFAVERSVEAIVLGVPVQVACLEDTTQGKLWAYADPRRRFSKRKKDELDLVRLVEAWPHLRRLYPPELLESIDRG
jgi:hypothetical protein